MSKSKKIIIGIIVLVVVIVLVLSGILVLNNISKQKREHEFKIATKEYYDKHMASLYGGNEMVVTLKAINNAIDNNKEKYNIKSLKNCSLESSAIFYIVNKKIDKQEIKLICD